MDGLSEDRLAEIRREYEAFPTTEVKDLLDEVERLVIRLQYLEGHYRATSDHRVKRNERLENIRMFTLVAEMAALMLLLAIGAMWAMGMQ